MTTRPRCPHCGIQQGVHYSLCPNYMPPKPPNTSPDCTPARRQIRDALAALGYTVRSVEWMGPYSLIDFGSDGGWCVDNFGSFRSANEFCEWIQEPGSFAAFEWDTRGFREAHDERAGLAPHDVLATSGRA